MTAIPATASATNRTTVGGLQTDVLAKLDGRLDRLAKLEQSVQSSSSLSAAEKDSLVQQLQQEESGLQGLRQHVTNDTTAHDVRADAKSMVVDYRVYKVMTPKVRLAEKLAGAEQRYDKLESKVAARQDPPAGAVSALAAAKDAFDGQSAQLLAVTPHDYSPDLFSRFESAVQAANSNLETAAQVLHHA